MIDGVKCSCEGHDADLWQRNPRLDFGLLVSESTGELLTRRQEAHARSLRFVISPKSGGGVSCSIVGSLHKYKNNNDTNYNGFTFSELAETLESLQSDFDINLRRTHIHSMEIGVNINLDYNPEIILKNVVCHKGKGFDSLDRKERKLGLICEHTDYAVKLYDKGRQSKIEDLGKYVLRYEVKVFRQRMLEPFSISTLADLQDVEKVAPLISVLADRLREIVFFDHSFKGDALTEAKRLNWERYSNPNYWANLNRNEYYKARKKHAELLAKYNCIDWGQFVLKHTTKVWEELAGFKQEKGRRFPHNTQGNASRELATFSNLEYLAEDVAGGDVEKRNPTKVKTEAVYCITCGRQITGQKAGSLFCSDRLYGIEARRCRNRDSNRLLAIKRKIYRAMKKEFMLRITYQHKGAEYTDTLGASELSITREWLDKVTHVEVLRPQPTTLTGNKAKEYLKHLKY